jgi:lipopolysaccharide biosynthesis regulator YciM
MWNDISVFVLVFIALFLGWLLSKFSVLDFLSKVKRRSWRRSYMQGIHLLLKEQSDTLHIRAPP